MDSLLSEISDANVKILLIVLDGLGDIPHPDKNNQTPLESARTPNLDRLTALSSLGRLTPVLPGITPGSGPAHLALFGYDPIRDLVGRGVLEALGLGMDVGRSDVAVRANFCTMNEKGEITDRRAGRIPTELNRELCILLSARVKSIDGVRVEIASGMSHRFAVVLKGKGLGSNVNDTDPQHEGLKPLKAEGKDLKSKKTAKIINKLMSSFREILKDRNPANGVLFRGISSPPALLPFPEKYRLRSSAIATYPMYKGLAKLVGMDVIKFNGSSIKDEISALKANFNNFDFFYLHIKETDVAGEDGNFDFKVKTIEEFDAVLPEILELNPDCIAITGDHSTPVLFKKHSWHPVPVLIHAKKCFRDGLKRFTEKNCIQGSIGTTPMENLMPLLLAHAGKLEKYGA
jgi:2,3-bisphosphoglycerate-independent phosphoglycerate mutase